MNYIKLKQKMVSRTLLFILSVIALFVVVSCSEDLLDKKPLNDISDVDIFNNDDLLENYVNGNYRAFSYFKFGAFHKDGVSDDAQNRDLAGYNRGEGTPDSDGGVGQGAWFNNYPAIRDTNIFFNRIENSTASPDVVKRLTGEMRFIRAWLYFDLMSLYGDVPLLTNLFELGQESFDTERTPYDEIVVWLVSELDLAISELLKEDTGGSFNGRATRGAAAALKSRVLLYAASSLHNSSNDMSKWEAARDAAKAVIDLGDYSIDDDYLSLYDVDISEEVIFARSFTEENKVEPWSSWNSSIDNYFLPRGYFGGTSTHFSTLQAIVDAYEYADGTAFDPENRPADPFANRDPRLDMTVIHHGSVIEGQTIEYHVDAADPTNQALAGPASFSAGGSNGNYDVLKQTDPTIDSGFGGGAASNPSHLKPWIFFRLAEAYLNYAEALIELGDDAGARTAIQVVRNRQGVNMPAFTESGTTLKERYRNERRVELAFENHRWYDIIRWKIAPEVLNKPAVGVTVWRDNTTNPPTDTYTYDDRVIDNLRTWDDKMYFLAIPRSEIEASPSLGQNPGYN